MNAEMFSGSVGPLLIAQVTLCVAAGLAASALLHKSAAKAHQVLLTTLAAAVLMPGAYAVVKHFQIGVLASEPLPVSPLPAESFVIFDMQPIDLPEVDAGYDVVPPIDDPEHIATTPLPWGTICLGGWIAFSTTLFGRLVLRFILGLRLVKTALPVESERLRQAVEAAKARMGIAGPVHLRCSRRIKSPIIWCWTRRPVLLVPAGAENQANADWVSVFCHELAHLRRRDHASGLFAEVLTAMLPWHPLLWWASARLSQLSEQACDDWVVAAGHSGVDYAETLLGLAAQRQMAFIPTVIGKEKTMNVRIRRIIKDRCGDPRIGARWTAGVSLLAMLAVVSVGFAQRRPVERRERDREVITERPVPEERRDEAPQWQREVLARKLDELAGQIRDRETMLREAREMPPEERRMQEFELDLLRDMTAQVERRLRSLNRPESRTPPEAERSRELDEQLNNVRRELEELTQATERTERELESLGDDQDAEARELQGRLRELREQTRRHEEVMADLERARMQAELQTRSERRTSESEDAVPRVRTQARDVAEAAMQRDRLAMMLRELTAHAGAIEEELRSRGDRESDRTRSLETELDKTHDAIREAEEALRRLEERQRTQPSEEPRGRFGNRDAPPEAERRDPYGDPYGGGIPRVPQPNVLTQKRRSVQPEDRITSIFRVPQGNLVQRREILQSVLGESGQVTADERTSSLVVIATPEGRERVERVLRELDVPGQNHDLRSEVDDLRDQMNGLREQLQEMQGLLREMAERERPQPLGPIQN